MPGVSFEGTQDVRVVDHAVALRIAIWLHRLDMAMGGEAFACETLDIYQHHQGPLLGSFLTPRTGNLMYEVVIDRVMRESHKAAEQSLCDLQECRTRNREALNGLIKAHTKMDKGDKAVWKTMKREIDLRHKDLESLREHILYYECELEQGPSEDNAPNGGDQAPADVQAEVAPVADDAPSESATAPASNPPPARDLPQDMEVEKYGARLSLPSPVSCEDDDLLLGLPPSGAMEVESGLSLLSKEPECGG